VEGRLCFLVIPWILVNVRVYDVQLLLPEGIRRDNNKMYEEVEIPANEPMTVGFDEKPIYISELDEVRDACTVYVNLDWFCFKPRLHLRFNGKKGWLPPSSTPFLVMLYYMLYHNCMRTFLLECTLARRESPPPPPPSSSSSH